MFLDIRILQRLVQTMVCLSIPFSKTVVKSRRIIHCRVVVNSEVVEATSYEKPRNYVFTRISRKSLLTISSQSIMTKRIHRHYHKKIKHFDFKYIYYHSSLFIMVAGHLCALQRWEYKWEHSIPYICVYRYVYASHGWL